MCVRLCVRTSWKSEHKIMMTPSNGNIFSRSWPFVWGIHRSPVNSPHKGQWRGALTFSLICTWINGWVNNRKAGNLRRHRAHYDVTIMSSSHSALNLPNNWLIKWRAWNTLCSNHTSAIYGTGPARHWLIDKLVVQQSVFACNHFHGQCTGAVICSVNDPSSSWKHLLIIYNGSSV